MNNKIMVVDKQIKKLLIKNDMTVSKLARATGISPKTIYQWMNGQKPRNIEQVKKVADYFNISLDALVFDNCNRNEIQEFLPDINVGVYEVVLRKIK